jgi:sulfite dehydrogenase (quinone) subunit SoeC
MHPAFSVIFFTVVSGSGYGLLFAAAIALAFDPHLLSRNEALLAVFVGAVLAAAGLTSSMLHLGQPQRAWRALSQWRSSWLSREGVAALASFLPITALLWLLWSGADGGFMRGFALLLAVLAVVTVLCTARIYTSLKTIHAWHNPYVLPGYLLLGLLAGIAWLQLIFSFSAPAASAVVDPHFMLLPPPNHGMSHSIGALLIGAIAPTAAYWKFAYWRFIDQAGATATVESATGLGRFGAVRAAEGPHTEANYLTNEMGFVLARKHARRLRAIALILLGGVPLLLSILLMVPATASIGWFGALGAAVLLASITLGAFVERWLFFAEAKHVVMLYYGPERG